jgi:hypothetical protein
MHKMRTALAGLALLSLGSAANAEYIGGGMRGNDTGGIIPWSCENEVAAREVAGAYCASWNKYARITSVHRMYGDYIAFNCLWRPDIARFQIPAVRTRSSCYAHARAPRLHPRVQVRY